MISDDPACQELASSPSPRLGFFCLSANPGSDPGRGQGQSPCGSRDGSKRPGRALRDAGAPGRGQGFGLLTGEQRVQQAGPQPAFHKALESFYWHGRRAKAVEGEGSCMAPAWPDVLARPGEALQHFAMEDTACFALLLALAFLFPGNRTRALARMCIQAVFQCGFADLMGCNQLVF